MSLWEYQHTVWMTKAAPHCPFWQDACVAVSNKATTCSMKIVRPPIVFTLLYCPVNLERDFYIIAHYSMHMSHLTTDKL